jgi:hypothetical protein
MFLNLYIDKNKAFAKSMKSDICPVAAIVDSIAWPADSKVTWQYIEERQDWFAYLHTEDLAIRRIWMELCQLFATIPNITRPGAGPEVTALALAKIQGAKQ